MLSEIPVRVNDGAAGNETINLKSDVALVPTASFTAIVMLKVPNVVGSPEIAPVVGSSDKPAGKAPALIDHVYGSVPCWAVTLAA